MEGARRAAQQQLDAYNAHDVDAFVACFDPDVVVRDLKTGEVQLRGAAALRESYGRMFERFPEVHAHVTSRTVVGNVAIDHEVVTGRGEVLMVVAIYEVNVEELITAVWFVR